MNYPSQRFPGPLGEEFAKLWAAHRARQPIETPTIRVEQSALGTALHAREPGTPPSPFVVCQVTEEGADALRATILGTATEILVAKPFHLQKNVWDAGMGGGHAEHQNDVASVSIVWEDYSGGIYGQPEWVLTLAHNNNKNGQPDAQEKLVIHPPYPPQCFVPTLVALRLPAVLHVNPVTLAFDAAGVAVHLLDLNLEARQWTKRTQAEYAEPVSGLLVRDA